MFTVNKALTILLKLIIFPTGSSFDPNVYGYSDNTEMLEAGRIQFQLLRERGNLPQYGSCWKQSIQNVEEGCRNLSEETQSDIALHLANCFLEMSGHVTYECITDKKPNLLRICINSMTDRAFNVYTEFYTHTQNMCWFLRGQIWHEEINKNTKNVGRKLEESSEKQDTLLLQQDAALKLQEKMLNYSNELNKIIGNFYLSSQKHQDLLGKLSNTLVNLQNWLIGEISWFDSVIFYVAISFLILFFTSTKRTVNARFPLIILLGLIILFERILCYQSYINNLDDNIVINNKLYYNYIWILRYIFIFASTIIILIYSLNYKDYLVENNILILQLHDKIAYVTNCLENSSNHNIKTSPNTRKSILNIESEVKDAQINFNTTDSNVLLNNLNNFDAFSVHALNNQQTSPILNHENISFRNNSKSRQNTPFSETSVDSNASRYNLRSRLITPTPERTFKIDEKT